MTKQAISHQVAVSVSRHRRHPALRFAARAARRYLEMIENRDYGFATNGERWLLHQVAATGPAVVFDVGANVGDWTAEVRRTAPAAHVHAFEIVPATARLLDQRFAGDPNVARVRAGLLDAPGSVRIKHYPTRPTLSGIALPGVHSYSSTLEHEWLDVAADSGDRYCDEHAVAHIDLLKIDAEGSDHLVLRGFARMLEAGAVDVVQFEYGRANILNKFLLVDFYRLLTGVDMVVGKLYPTYVDFREYDIDRHEDFLGPNYVAVRRDRVDLIARLSGRARG